MNPVQLFSSAKMPVPLVLAWVLVLAATLCRSEPTITAQVTDSEVVVTIGARSVVPQGEALFARYQLEGSFDAQVWEPLDEPVAQRAGGEPESHQFTFSVSEAKPFYRVAWSLDLVGTDLSGRDLTGADLRAADLAGANLAGADLSDADFRGADLSGTNLGNADLGGANLEGTVLRGATTTGLIFDRLGGKQNLPVAKRIPRVPHAPLETDYSLDHPELPGLPLSHNTVVMTFKGGTTTAEANRVFGSVGAGFITGVASETVDGSGVFIVKIPANTHTEMKAALVALRAEPSVGLASCDVLLEPTSVPPPNGNMPSDWNWQTLTGGGNWGFKMSRIPQMWNFNDGLHKSGHVAASGGMSLSQSSDLRSQRKLTVTGVIDVGFFIAHPDLAITDWPNDVPRRYAHGTHVAATIGAFFADQTGVEGVNPFRYLVVSDANVTSVGPLAGRMSWAAAFLLNFGQLVSEFPDTRVVNMSLGYNWYKTGTETEPRINPATDAAVPVLTSIHGGLFDALLRSIDNPPLVFAAAGNDDDEYAETILAKDGSPMSNAGIEWDNPNVVVVEAIYELAGAPGGAWRAPYSNRQGHISAPGGHPSGPRVLSAVDPDDLNRDDDPPMQFGVDYDYLHGTSMATPHVTGLASYLFTLDPDLTNAQVRSLILSNVLPAGGDASPRIDAFSAAMAHRRAPRRRQNAQDASGHR